MFQWLNGPGAAFRDPLPGSTNYLGAYDDKGQLTRVTRAGDRKKKGGEDSPEGPLSEGKQESSTILTFGTLTVF